MLKKIEKIGRIIESSQRTLVEEIVSRQCLMHPEYNKTFNEGIRQNFRDDAGFHLAHLAQSMSICCPTLLSDYVVWARNVHHEKGRHESELLGQVEAIIDVLRDRLANEESAIASRFIESAIAAVPRRSPDLTSCIDEGHALSDLAHAYTKALLMTDRHAARRLIFHSVDKGTPIRDIYMHVLQPSQREIGRLWQMSKINVAQEHFCSSATAMIMSQLNPLFSSGIRGGKVFLGATASGETHDIGIRMVTDFFEMEGWSTIYLGANVPAGDLVRAISAHKPDVVGISASITTHITVVAQMITAIRANAAGSKIKILVGGHPFCIVPGLWKQIGADGSSRDAQGAMETTYTLAA